ncbi:MAG: hypothetical protein R3F42_06640 [Pseudomonadota bacterium]
MRIPKLAKGALLALSLAGSGCLDAGELALFAGQGADVNLPDIIPKLFRQEIEMDPTYFWGLNYSREIELQGHNPVSRFLLDYGITPEWEVQLTKHRGLQDNYEAHLAWLLRTGNLELGSIATVNLATGMGPSYAFSKPTYEDGPDGQPNQGEYQFQNYITFELEFGTPVLPDWSLALRVHHRSGMYGLIAPRRVGSNFFALGIRHTF